MYESEFLSFLSVYSLFHCVFVLFSFLFSIDLPRFWMKHLLHHWIWIVFHFELAHGRQPPILDWFRSTACHPSECIPEHSLLDRAKTDMETNLKQIYESNSSFLSRMQNRFPFPIAVSIALLSFVHVLWETFCCWPMESLRVTSVKNSIAKQFDLRLHFDAADAIRWTITH